MDDDAIPQNGKDDRVRIDRPYVIDTYARSVRRRKTWVVSRDMCIRSEGKSKAAGLEGCRREDHRKAWS